jgi:hypothetical protein
VTPLVPPAAIPPAPGAGQGGAGGAAPRGTLPMAPAPPGGGAVVQILAVVAGRGGDGVTLASPDGPLRLGGAPDLPQGARLTLELATAARPGSPAGPPAAAGDAAPGAAGQPVRLLAVDGQALQPARPVTVAPLPGGAVTVLEPRPGTPVTARIADGAGRVLQDALPVRLALAAGAAPGRVAAPEPEPAQRGGMATLPAEVAGRDAQGRLVLHAAELVLRIEGGRFDLPAGAALLVLLPVGWDRPARAADPLARLLQALAGLGAGDSGAAGDGKAAQTLLPRPDGAFGARLLAFYQAMAQGRSAPLERIGLEPGAGPAGRAALDEALGELQRLGRQPTGEGWRGWAIPVAAGEGAPGGLRLHVHDDTPGGREAGEEGAQRAVFELELRRLGRLQLDVLVQGRRLDLRLRSERPLPDGLGQVLAHGLAEAGLALGLESRLGFAPGELLPLPEPLRPPPADLSV